MIDKLWMYTKGEQLDLPVPVEQVFNYGVRFEVIVQSEEEFDYLFALQLMFGRELEMKTWAEWKEEYDVMGTLDVRYKKVPLPFTFTTFPMDFSELR